MANAALALDFLFDRSCFRRRMRRWVAPQDADDLLQAVAEKLLQCGAETDLSPGYVSRVARNAAIDRARSTQSRSDYETEFAQQCPRTDEMSPERVAEGLQAIEALDDALTSLPELTREVFLLYYVEGLAQRDIAAQFGLHVSSIEKHLAKARRHCYERIEPHLAEE